MRPVPGYERYKACENGDIIGLRGGKLTPRITNRGYLSVGLHKEGTKPKSSNGLSVHRVIAAAYLGLDLNNPNIEVNHIDGDKLNCRVDNLELCTASQNRVHMLGLKWPSDTVSEKECRKCGFIKSVDHFYKNPSNRDGLGPYCKKCKNEINKGRYYAPI